MADLTRTKLTAAEFYEMFPETTAQIELIEGEVIVSPSAKDIHGEIVLNLILLVGNHVKAHELGQMRTAPNDVHLSATEIVQPDIHFVSKENSVCKKGEDGYWHGAPDLVIEILSPGTMKLDRVTKFELYQKHGVREYWIVDPLENFIEVYVLDGGQYRRHGAYTETETLTSVVLPELTLTLAEVFPAEGGVESPPAS